MRLLIQMKELAMKFEKVMRRWFPAKVDIQQVEMRLAEFYRKSEQYHNMTRGGDKTAHPQVQLLLSLIRQGENYVEIGCGGGQICREVGKVASVKGVDVSPIAITHARELCEGQATVSFMCASAAGAVPLGSGFADGVYSFEVLEHVWDPERVLLEMIRITKPGGFVLVSMPNGFSLDLQINKRWEARCLDFVFAVCRRLRDSSSGRSFLNINPSLDGEVWPDCDMVTAVIPSNLVQWIKRQGCELVFWDTFYMAAHRSGGNSDLDYQRNAGRLFLKHFGDHLLLYVRKSL